VLRLLVTANVVPCSCHPHDGGDAFLRNVCSYKNHTASHPSRRHSSFCMFAEASVLLLQQSLRYRYWTVISIVVVASWTFRYCNSRFAAGTGLSSAWTVIIIVVVASWVFCCCNSCFVIGTGLSSASLLLPLELSVIARVASLLLLDCLLSNILLRFSGLQPSAYSLYLLSYSRYSP
jgi:hypothetical protein